MKEDIVFIKHVLDSIESIEKFSKNMEEKDFLADKLRQNAIIREIEIIGEAMKNISQDFKKKNIDIEWKKIVGTRDKLIHNYFGIDLNLIWKVVKRDIPILEEQMNKIRKDLTKNKQLADS